MTYCCLNSILGKADPAVKVNGMGTIIAGDFDKAIELTKRQVHEYLEQKDAVFLMKIAKGQQT